MNSMNARREITKTLLGDADLAMLLAMDHTGTI